MRRETVMIFLALLLALTPAAQALLPKNGSPIQPLKNVPAVFQHSSDALSARTSRLMTATRPLPAICAS